MRFLLIALFVSCCCCSAGIFAQLSPVKHSVKLHNGEEYSGDRLIYISPILRTSEFEFDGRKFESNEIAFFKNNHGYFANLNRIYNDKAERYAFRIKQGKVDLYEEIDIEYYGGDELEAAESSERNEMLAKGDEFQYFSKGSGGVMKANYRNLKLALSDNPESKKEMNVFRNYRYLQIGMIGAAAGLIAYDIMRQNDAANASSEENIRLSPMIALGIVIGGSSYFIESAKENARWMAADKYNRITE